MKEVTRSGKEIHQPPVTNKITGIGWSGLYADGTPGFLISEMISDGEKAQNFTDGQMEALEGKFFPSDMYRVKITIEVLKNKNGKYITKRTRRV
jgi:hypothetical protein